jgi:hypothetical protein
VDLPQLRPPGHKKLRAADAVAVHQLHTDVYANSSVRPRLARSATWDKLAGQMGCQPLPITQDLVTLMAAAFKQAGYRSANLYFHEAVQRHVQTYGTNPAPDIVLHIRNVVRSIKRGLPPPRLKTSFRVENSSPLLQNMLPPCRTATHIVAAHDFTVQDFESFAIVLGCWFMVRGIEIANARRGHLQVDSTGPFPAVTWFFPVSKSDTNANGVRL